MGRVDPVPKNLFSPVSEGGDISSGNCHIGRVQQRVEGLSSHPDTLPRVSGKANKNFAGGDLVGVCPLPESSKNCSEWLA